MRNDVPLIQKIFDLLVRDEDSLTSRQINDRLTELGIATGGISNIAAHVRQGEIVGQFIRAEIQGQLRWTNNPEWRVMPRKNNPVDVVVSKDEATAAASAIPKSPKSEEIVAAKPGPQFGAPHNLTERLDAIADDLRDAVLDACRAELPHRLIGALVEANNAALAAARQLAKV